MSDVSRFERGEPYSTHGDTVTYRGIDPLTGLDVLIYDFPGRPTLRAGTFASERALNVLSAVVKRDADGERGTVVVALPTGSSLVAPGEAVVDDQFVLQALEGALDASRFELVHGDISPSRVLYAKGRVYLEGYGVPWAGSARAQPAQPGTGQAGTDHTSPKQAALAADLSALVRSLLELAGDNLSTEVTVALRSALAPGSYPPMTAQRLFSIVKRLAGGAVTLPTSGFSDLTLPVTPGHDPLALDPEQAPAASRASVTSSSTPASRAAPTPVPSSERADEAALRRTPAGAAAVHERYVQTGPSFRSPHGGAVAPAEPDPITLTSDPGIAPPDGGSSGGRDTSPGFVKDLPPGATYKAGNLEDSLRPAPFRFDKGEERAARVRSWRGPALLLLLLLTASLAAYLAFMARQPGEGSPTVFGLGQYTIDVSVFPANLPPVSLVVDESPPGSTYRPGTVMGSVPRKVPFDVAGTWVVHAVFRDRVTDSVTVVVPDDGAITLTFPPTTNP